jgi:ATP-dependent Clp protease ATP-binding subunit ClpA
MCIRHVLTGSVLRAGWPLRILDIDPVSGQFFPWSIRPAACAPWGAESTLQRALACANQRRHEYTTLEHLLLALTDDVDAAAVIKACAVDLGALKENLIGYVDNELTELATGDGNNSRPTAGFRRVVQRAALHVRAQRRDTVTGAQLVAHMFAERESRAVWLLGEQAMTRLDAMNFIDHGTVKGSGDAAV